MANNDILKSKELIENFNKVWDEHSKFINKANASLEAFVNNAKIPSNYVKAIKEVNTNNQNLAESYDKVNKAQKKITTSQKALETARLKELRLATKREKKFDQMDAKMKREEAQAKKNAAAQKKLTSAWFQLTEKLKKAELEYRDLAAAQGVSNKQTIKAQKHVQELRKKMDSINTPIKRFGDNVGNYKSALGGIKNIAVGLFGALGVIEGLRFGFEFTKEAVEMAKAAKGVEFAFNRLGESGQEAFSNIKKSTRGLVGDIDIKRSLVDFQNFNIDLEQTDVLFEFLSVRANQTGKSIDSLKDSLVEGLSKESKLRIDNLGISTADLNSELEKTPDFVSAVANIARREVKEAGGILDEAANSSERFKVVLGNAQLELGKLFTSSSFGFLGVITDKIEELGKAFKSIREGFFRIKRGFDAFMKPLKEAIKQVPWLTKTLGFLYDKFKFVFDLLSTSGLTVVGKFFNHFGAGLSGLGAAISETIKSVKEFYKSISFLGEVFTSPVETAKKVFNGGFKDMIKTATIGAVNIGTAFVKAYKKALEPLKEEITEPTSSTGGNGTGDGTGRTLPKIENVEIIKAAETTSTYRQQIELLIDAAKKLRDEQMEGSSEWESYNSSIEFYNSLLENGLKVSDDFIEQMNAQIKSNEDARIAMDALKKATEDYLNTFSDGFFADAGLGGLQIFLDIDEQGQSTFDRLLAGADTLGEKFAVTFNAISEVGQEAFNLINQASQQNFEAEYSRLEEQKEISLQFAGDSTTAKQEIEEQYETRRKQIARRQAEAEKRSAMFNIGIDTAQAVISTLAKTPPPAGIPLATAVGVIGAAQLAIVAAKQIPQFWEGGVVGSEQQIMVNDDPYGKKGANYKEVIQKPNGQTLRPQGKNVKMTVPKGTIVHPTYSDFDMYLNGLLENSGIAPFFNNSRTQTSYVNNNNGLSKSELLEVMNNHANKLANTIKNKPTSSTNFDENGFKHYISNGHSKKQIRNARVNGRGLDV